MKRGKLFFFSLFLVMIPAMFTSCIISEAILRLAGWYDAPAVFSQLDDGGKLVEKRKTLEDADFQGSNFFIKDTPNEYFIDLNGQVLNLIKKDLKNGSFYPIKSQKNVGFRETAVFAQVVQQGRLIPKERPATTNMTHIPTTER